YSLTVNAQIDLPAGDGRQERDGNVMLDLFWLSSAARLTLTATAESAEVEMDAPAAELPHQFLDHFLRHAASPAGETAEPAASESALGSVGRAEPVVVGAFRGVAEHVVSVLNFLELGLGLFIAGVAVGVIFSSQRAVGFGDVRFAGVAGYAQSLIHVARHGGGLASASSLWIASPVF